MKICVFGGMFDPPHIGHEEIVAKLVEKFDKVIIVPSKVTPAKEHKPAVSDFHRMKMLSLCNFPNASKCVISDYEITSCKSPSYTINTLRYIKNRFKKSDISIAIGLDQLNNFNSWYESKEIISIAKIVCFNRKVKSKKKISVNYEFINNFDYNISSSDIRDTILRGNNQFRTMVSENIFNYIIKENLYK